MSTERFLMQPKEVTEAAVEYRADLSGKHVALVGGAPAADLDRASKADLVVHTNLHWQRHDGRCDIVYAGCHCPCDKTSLNLKWILHDVANPIAREWGAWARYTGVPRLPYSTERFRECNPYSHELEWSNALAKRLGTMPLTGIVALHHLLMQPIASLFVTAFTFYREDGRMPERRDSHLLPVQERYLYDLARYDARVEMDAELWRWAPYTKRER